MNNPLLSLRRPSAVRPDPARSTSRRPSSTARRSQRRAGDRHRARLSRPTGPPSPWCSMSPPSGLAAPGARSATSTAWPTRPSCAPPTTQPCPRSPSSGPRLGADERLYAKYKAIDPATLNTRAAPGAQECPAQFRAGRRRAARRGARALCGHPGTPGRPEPEVQRERARCHRRLRLLRAAPTNSTACPRT